MPKLIPAVEAWLVSEAQSLEAAVEADWATLKPQIVALGRTLESQVLAAAVTFVTSGGNFADALASVVGQLPGDAKALEAIVAGALSAKVAALKTAAVIPAAAPAAAPAA